MSERLTNCPRTITSYRSIRGIKHNVKFPAYATNGLQPLWIPKSTHDCIHSKDEITFGILLTVRDAPYDFAPWKELQTMARLEGIDSNRIHYYRNCEVNGDIKRSNVSDVSTGIDESEYRSAAMLIYKTRAEEDVKALEECFKRICLKSVFIKSIVQVYTHSVGVDDFSLDIERLSGDNNCSKCWMDHVTSKKETFKFALFTINKRIKDKFGRQQEMLNTLKDWLPQGCSAEMIWPDHQIWCIEIYPRNVVKGKGLSEEIHRFYCRAIADTGSLRIPPYQKLVNLGDRPILGPTTLEPELAFMMANMANVSKGELVLDPFVGTGGILIPCSVMGAEVFGADMDMRVIKGYGIAQLNRKYANEKQNWSNEKGVSQTDKSQRSDIYVNFEAYGLPKPNILRVDITQPAYRRSLKFDAIVTDPPYGIRAPSRVIKGIKDSGIAKTDAVHWERVYQSLMEFAGDVLVDDGRLCFLLPCPSFDPSQGMDNIMEWGKSNGLELVNTCYQQLQTMGRNIICMKKVKTTVLVEK